MGEKRLRVCCGKLSLSWKIQIFWDATEYEDNTNFRNVDKYYQSTMHYITEELNLP